MLWKKGTKKVCERGHRLSLGKKDHPRRLQFLKLITCVCSPKIWKHFNLRAGICKFPQLTCWKPPLIPLLKLILILLFPGPSTCIYYHSDSDNHVSHVLKSFLFYAVEYALYAPLFLLTLSRFLSMYFHYFQFKSTTKVASIIIVFNLVFIAAVNLDTWYWTVINVTSQHKRQACMDACGDRSCNETEQHNCDWIGLIDRMQTSITPFRWVQIILPPLLLIFSNICAFSLVIKLIQQVIFRAQTHSQNLGASLRIALVILFQCLTTTFLFVISCFQDYLWYFLNRSFNGLTRQKDIEFIRDSYPPWFRFLVLPETLQCFSMIRIFLDSIVILVVLTSYRNQWIDFIQFILWVILNPKTVIKKLGSRKNSKVAFVSQNSQPPRPLSRTLSIRAVIVNWMHRVSVGKLNKKLCCNKCPNKFPFKLPGAIPILRKP